MYLYGTGGIAIVAIEVLKDAGQAIDGLFDDDPDKQEFLGYPVRPGLDRDPALRMPADAESLICIGDNRRRAELIARLQPRLGRTTHPTAIVSPTASIGAGTLVFHAARVQAATRVGRAVILNTGASVDHDCRVGDYVHIAPNVTLCGHVTVGEGADIGAASVVIPGVRIGRWATLGAGSVVVRDIPDHALAVGCPARVIRMQDAYAADTPAGLDG